MKSTRLRMLAAGVVLSAMLPSCGPYTIRGRVIEGDASYVAVVDKDDHRLDVPRESGVAGALLRLQLDPGRINRRKIAEETSGQDGAFSLPIDEFGAGVLQLEGGLLVRRTGFKAAEGVFTIPDDKKRILVILAPGRDAPGAFEDEPTVEEQMEQFR